MEFTFRLKRLAITFGRGFLPPRLLQALITPTLTSVAYDFVSAPPMHLELCLRAMECHASFLEKAELRGMRGLEDSLVISVAYNRMANERGTAKDRIRAFWKHFSNLKEFTCLGEDVGYLPFISENLVVLKVSMLGPRYGREQGTFWNTRREIFGLDVEALDKEVTRFKKLKVLRVELDRSPDTPRWGPQWTGFVELPKYCKAHGVTLEWVGDWKQPPFKG